MMRQLRRFWLIGLILVGALATAGSMFLPAVAREDDKATEPSRKLGARLACLGYVDVERGVVALSPVQPGRVVDVAVHEGDKVEAGTVLLRLDDRALEARVAEAQAALAAAQAQLSELGEQTRLLNAQKEQQETAITVMQHRLASGRFLVKHKQKLQEKNVLSDAELASAEENVHELEAMLEGERQKLDDLQKRDVRPAKLRADAEVAVAEARLRQAQQAREECGIRAPSAGTVLRLSVGVGDVVSVPARQPAIQFARESPMVVRAEVEQEFSGRVAVGQPATIRDDSDPTQTWQGEVIRVADWFTSRRLVADDAAPLRDVPTLECVVAVKPGERSLKINQRVRVVLGEK